MVFGVIKFGEGWRAKIKCKCTGMEKPKVSMTGDKISKMRCAAAILVEVAREMFPDDVLAQNYAIQTLARDAQKEVIDG